MRWYNPGLRVVAKPEIDEEALSLLKGHPSGELCAEVYGAVRAGAGVMPELIQAGEEARLGVGSSAPATALPSAEAPT